MYQTPILFLVFNRTDTTEKVFAAIKKLQPAYLYVAADGPRINKEGEAEKCAAVRAIIDNGVDWPCTIKKLYRTDNLGCGVAVSEAISWFFEHEEQGIILEDDTLPNESFFSFCSEMLALYMHNEEVMHISGSNYADTSSLNESHYFTRLPFIWGWATWKRAWKHYDFSLKYASADSKLAILNNAFSNPEIVAFWNQTLQHFALTPKSYTWDYQWFLSLWRLKGLVVQPSKNLVTNIGFGEGATHTSSTDHHLADLQTQVLNSEKVFTRKTVFVVDYILENINFKFYFQGSRVINNWQLKDLVKKISITLPYKVLSFLKPFYHNLSNKILNTTPVFQNMKESVYYPNSIIDYASVVSNKSKIYPRCELYNTKINDFTYVAEKCIFKNTTVGKFCSIGPNLVSGWGIHPTNGISTSPMFYSTMKQNGFTLSSVDKIQEMKPVYIGNDVFIGMNVTILDGVSIGDGAIIGAGAVVSKDIPPYAIAVGVPIKIIKYRFDEPTIKNLLKMKWWDWEENELHKVEKNFFDLKTFIGSNN